MKRVVRMYNADDLYKLLLQDVDDIDASLLDCVRVLKGELVYDVGDLADNLWVLLSGKVRVSRRVASGVEVTRAIYVRGDFFGMKALLFGSEEHDECAVATSDSVLCKIPLECVQRGVKEDPSFAKALNVIIHKRYEKAERRADILHCSDIHCRVREFIYSLSAEFGTEFHGGVLINHPYTQNEIAQLLGTSRPTVNKVLKSLESNEEISFNRKRIVLLKR
ncbi:MAG: Crp/Fnr family transcriptional regulator [Bacteroidales bacterium]